MLTSNADLRQEIDSLRVERKRFEGMHKKLDKELTSLRKQIAEEIDQSTMAYDSRYMSLFTYFPLSFSFIIVVSLNLF